MTETMTAELDSEPNAELDPPPTVSIVVCTYNRAEMLKDCLQSLIEQETADEFTFEIVVVDNASPDDTREVVSQISKGSDVSIRYVYEEQAGQVFARHRGFDAARGEWIANFDDDEAAEPDWLLELLRLAKKKNVRSVGGLLKLRLPESCTRELHPRVRRVLGESVMWPEPRPYSRRQGPGSGNQLIHRSVLDEVGRYDLSHSVRGYDTDHYRRMREAGIDSWFTPKAVAYHITPESRLTAQYLSDTCFHDGWCFCRRDVEHFGFLKCFFVLLARIVRTLGQHLTASMALRILGNKEASLAHWLMLRRLEGYVRCYFYQLAPGLFAQRRTRQRYGL